MSVYSYVFGLAKASPAVTGLLGSPIVRFWQFGMARQNELRPYAVYTKLYGNPDNSLACTPREDLQGFQVDAFGRTSSEANAVADALRDALEASYTYLVNDTGDEMDDPTKLYRVSRTYEVWLERSGS